MRHLIALSLVFSLLCKLVVADNPFCKVIDPNNPENCLECERGYYLYFWDYKNVSTCSSCPVGCSDCTSYDICKECSTNYTISINTCYKNCIENSECDKNYYTN